VTEELPWLTLTEAAEQTGQNRETLRSKVRRGLLTTRRGNSGQIMVQLPAGDLGATRAVTGPDQGITGPALDEVAAELRDEIAELRERLARAESDVAAAERVRAAEVGALRELADRLTDELADARRNLADARRPWWARLFASR
jgi:hypothetical protein